MRTKWIHTILVLALGFFASCSNEVDEAAINKKTRTIVFRLSVDDAVESRADGDWSTNDSPLHGTGIENRIDLKGLRVAIYSIKADGTIDKRLGVANNVLYWANTDPSTSTGNDPVEYQLVGDISDVPLQDGESYRFMVYANFPHTTDNFFDVDDVNGSNGYIPMWGVKTHSITGADSENLGTVDLLRAAVKVEVQMDLPNDIKNNYTLKNVALSCYNSHGYCHPYGYDVASETKLLDQEFCFNEYRKRVTTPISFDETAQGSQSFFIYVPEYDNQVPPEEFAEINLKVQHGDDANDIHDYSIKFTDYQINEMVRNHIYRFTIKNVHAGNLELNYEVADWNNAAADNWNLDFNYPTYVNPLKPLENIDQDETDDKPFPWSPTMTYTGNDNDDGAFVCCFQMTAPADQRWIPVLKAGANKAYIKVYKFSEYNNVVFPNSSNEGILASEDWYVIKVIPNDPNYDEYVELGITYSQTWMGQSGSRYLLINGEGSTIYWKNPEDTQLDPRLIRIKQVVNSN